MSLKMSIMEFDGNHHLREQAPRLPANAPNRQPLILQRLGLAAIMRLLRQVLRAEEKQRVRKRRGRMKMIHKLRRKSPRSVVSLFERDVFSGAFR